ncbi:sensor domain-containing diguanylate cyclase [Oceanimonas marisflavi]|uniref:sensor domain-containing diguanylate cyclase n=1 Tax=Oceanimonas marisflavi TaxID=2059724 RepID=UPI000D2FFC45|nr:sensor domain-containing diguanylate cyclase [Oceanimonas marisflavi]
MNRIPSIELLRLQAENERLKRIAADAREKLEAAMDGTGLCVWQLHVPSGKLIIFNRRWGSMLGFQPKELEASFEVWKAHLHPEDREEVLNNFYDHLHGRTPFYEVQHRMVAKNGTVTWVQDRGRVVEWDDQGRPLRVMGTHIDITQEKEYELALSRLAHKDPLTGLLNRSGLIARFKALKTEGELTLCFIDLDDFKQVNDTLGHRAGDRLLVQFTERLHHLCPPEVVLGRLGGDEFVLLLPWSLHQARTQELGQACIDCLDAPFELDNGEACVGMSMGIEAVRERDDFADVMARADAAMYQVKRAGKHGMAVNTAPLAGHIGVTERQRHAG